MSQEFVIDIDDSDTEAIKEVPVPCDETVKPGRSRTKRGLAHLLQELEPLVNDETQIYKTRIKTLLNACHTLRKAPIKDDEQGSENSATDAKMAKVSNTRNTSAIEDITNKRSLSPPPPPTIALPKKRRPQSTKKLLAKVQHQKDAYMLSCSSSMLNATLLDADDGGVDEADVANREITVKFRWLSNVHRLPMRRREPFMMVASKIAEAHSIPKESLLLSLYDRSISLDDTPDTISLSICDIIECSKLSTSTDRKGEEILGKNLDPDMLTLKLQTKDQRMKIEISMKKQHQFLVLKKKYSVQTGAAEDKITLKFDGEVLADDETPEDLDIEDGYCIDVVLQT